MDQRDLDVVVFGATGVTGRRVAAHLAGSGDVRWAAAARDRVRLAGVLSGLGVSAPEIIEADVCDSGSLARMARRSRVVLNLVGPYTLYGRPVIEACIAGGAHYVDLTGEMPFVREVLDELDAPAREAGVKIVQVCGFEALPPDLLVAHASALARERWDEALTEADVVVWIAAPAGLPRLSDGVSGGTFQSVAALAGAPDAALVTDPAALIGDSLLAQRVRAVSPIGLAPRAGEHGAVIAPMSPAAYINPAVIHRSGELAAGRQGREAQPLRYREGLALEGGAASAPLRWAAAGAMSGTQLALRTLAHARPSLRGPVASLLGRVGPHSGFGPDGERMQGWRWGMRLRASTASGHEVTGAVDGDGHPGYLATARMLAEAGVMLASDGLTPGGSGALTPSAALGTDQLGRFEAARVRFTFTHS